MSERQMTPAEVARRKKRIQNPDSSVSTERTITVGFTDNEGGPVFVNIPSIWDGVQLDQDSAVARAMETGIKQYPAFRNIKDATSAAQKRSALIGKAIKKAR